MTSYTKQETAAINEAWRAIKGLCECTNWTDAADWREAEKLERRQVPEGTSPSTGARAMICMAWAEGLDNPDLPLSNFYWIRRGCREAQLLGVRHAVERRGTDYNGPMVEAARKLCDAVIAANDAHTKRIVEG